MEQPTAERNKSAPLLDPEPDPASRLFFHQVEYSQVFPETGVKTNRHTRAALEEFEKKGSSAELGPGHYVAKAGSRYSISKESHVPVLNGSTPNYGEVILAYDHKLKRKRAIKFLSINYRLDTEEAKKLILEAYRYGQLEHPNVIKVYDIVVRPEDGTLGVVLEELKPLPGAYTREQFEVLARDVASALDYVHSKGYIHNDVNDRNIMMTPDGRFKLIDFGEMKEAATMSSVDVPVFAGDAQVGEYPEKADQYKLAELLNSMLVYSVLVATDSVQSDEVREVFRKAKHPERAARYSSCTEMVNDLLRVLEEKLSIIEPSPPPTH